MRDKDRVISARLAYADVGIYTLLVHGLDTHGRCSCGNADCRTPAKHPVHGGSNWGATTNEGLIREQAKDWPTNVAIHAGLSSLAVIDVDPRNGGNDTLAEIEKAHGSIHVSMVADSGGGGEHVLFDWSDPTMKLPGSLGAGVDVIAGNKYFIAEPSTHVSGGSYKWRGGFRPAAFSLLSPVPSWILERAQKPDSGQSDIDEWDGIEVQLGETPENVRRVRSALAMISADCPRNAWRDIVFSIKSTGWGVAEELARDWSMAAPKAWSEVEFNKIWESATPRKAGGRTIASVFWLARQRGWEEEIADKASDNLGDITSSRLFAKSARGQLLYDWSGKTWFFCENGVWQASKSRALDFAKGIADEILLTAIKSHGQVPTDATKRRLGQARSIHGNAKRLKAMLELAAAEPGIGISDRSAFDADPMVLGFRGGKIDLRTGKWSTSCPDDMICRIAGVEYDANASCPEWLAFLEKVFPDEEVRDFVKVAVGYSLLGLVDEEVLLFAYGSGANGKSVFANVLFSVFGGYSQTVSNELVRRSKHETEGLREKVRLPGARLVLMNEVGQNDTWDDQRIKEITSRERISARHLFSESFDFMPTHTLWIRGNHLPGILDAGEGMWRRIAVIPFTRTFKKTEQIADLDRKLVSREGSGILNWALEGCRTYFENGLKIPGTVSHITSRYRQECDVDGDWVSSRLVPDIEAWTDIGELYADYSLYMQKAGMKPRTQPAFTRMLHGRGYRSVRSNGRRVFHEIRLS